VNAPHYWLPSAELSENPDINPTFQQLLSMSADEFEAWVFRVRSTVRRVWDEDGTPPDNGVDEDGIVDEFCQMAAYDVSMLQARDDEGHSVILNTPPIGSCVNQFFPTMYKTKINYGAGLTGYSVYDLFADDRFVPNMQVKFRRHFLRDSFGMYSHAVTRSKDAQSAVEWVQDYFNSPELFEDWDFWFSVHGSSGTGYSERGPSNGLWLSKDQIAELRREFADFDGTPPRRTTNVDPLVPGIRYYIRKYKKNTRIFPKGFTAFRIGYIQVAMNFPPLVAKFLYEKYTEHCKTEIPVTVYDPSAGWGGRIAGAMCASTDRRLLYVGTDPNAAPNSDNFLPDLGITRYQYLANSINDAMAIRANVRSVVGYNEYDLFQSESQYIHTDPRFQKYRGRIDFVFSSPPYWNRELYSEDASQAAIEFEDYEQWREGFLRPTLEMAAEYLRPNRFLAWNIADIKIGNTYYHLEDDSRTILERCGLEFRGVEKMLLSNMPGANRVDEEGNATAKNSCKIRGKLRKMEPILIFWKGPGKAPPLP
jgi:hypothetical protein